MLSGAADVKPAFFRVAAGFAFKKKPGRREWLRARLETAADGSLRAMKYHADGSGILASMVEADGLIELSEDQGPFDAGAPVKFLPFNEVSR